MKTGIKIINPNTRSCTVAVFEDEDKAAAAFWTLRYLETANVPKPERTKECYKALRPALGYVHNFSEGGILIKNGMFYDSINNREQKDDISLLFNGNYVTTPV